MVEIWAVVYNCCGCPDANLDSLWTRREWAEAALEDINEADRKIKDYQVVRYEVATEETPVVFG
jgi:hypothetical protein